MESQEQIIEKFEELVKLPVEEVHEEISDLKASFYTLNHQKLI